MQHFYITHKMMQRLQDPFASGTGCGMVWQANCWKLMSVTMQEERYGILGAQWNACAQVTPYFHFPIHLQQELSQQQCQMHIFHGTRYFQMATCQLFAGTSQKLVLNITVLSELTVEAGQIL